MPVASRTRDDGLARLPTWRVGTEPAGGLTGRTLIFDLHIHAPGEDTTVRAVDSPLALGYARRSTEAGFEVLSGTVEDVDEAHVFVLTEQTRLRQADLEQPQLLSLPVSLGEVSEQLALIVGNEAALYPAPCPHLAHGVPGPRIVAPIRKIGGAGALGHEEDARQTRLIPTIEGIDEGDNELGHLPRVATLRERGVVTGDDHLCRILANYMFMLAIPARRM